MINTAGVWYPPNNKTYLKSIQNELEPEERIHPFKISSMECFDEYEKIQQAEFLSTMLMVHLADRYLAPTGYMIFISSKNAMDHDPNVGTPLEKIAKGTVMQQALNLSVLKMREDIVYENTNINTFVCDTLIQPRNQEMYPGKDVRKDWNSM